MLMQKASLLLSIKDSTWENREKKRSKNLKNLWKKLTMLLKLLHCYQKKLTSQVWINLLTLQELLGLKLSVSKMSVSSKKRKINRRKGDWTFNMNRQINELRADINKISLMNDPTPLRKMKRNTNSMKTKYQIVDEQTRSTSLETLKQRLYALNNRLSRYQRRQKQYQQNNDFMNKIFWWTTGELNHHRGRTNQGRHRKVLEAAIWEQKRIQ